ncbi:c-type cytochrome [Aestuariivita boseongensis]|uniref:c-type cytochrome n=1 Tax=Aestuariivita boseongensis TaxID=1470562 RepID=UPI00068270CF|nr:cytochrome c [Aestuariivita boseongensis]
MRLILLSLLAALGLALPAQAQDDLGLQAPEAVIDSGLLKHLLPRFSLKTGIRVRPDAGGQMIIATDGTGVAVFQRGETVFFLQTGDDPREARFRDWLTSDIGIRTVESFQPADGAAFTAPIPVVAEEDEMVFDGDPVAGAALSLTHCGRCHVIGPQNAMNSIGSTPSFAVLRAMSNWDNKFLSFYVLRPHAVFTQVEGLTQPFDPAVPSPIAPVRITPEELDSILAYVAQVKPADLGAPLQFQ